MSRNNVYDKETGETFMPKCRLQKKERLPLIMIFVVKKHDICKNNFHRMK